MVPLLSFPEGFEDLGPTVGLAVGGFQPSVRTDQSSPTGGSGG